MTVKLPVEKLRALFDIAVESMDFGSGFLEDEEVELLREIARTLGVDPIVGTPANFYVKYGVPLDAREHKSLVELRDHPKANHPGREGHWYRNRLAELQARYDASGGAVRGASRPGRRQGGQRVRADAEERPHLAEAKRGRSVRGLER